MQRVSEKEPPKVESTQDAQRRILQLEEENIKLRAELAEIDRREVELQSRLSEIETIFHHNPGFAAYQAVAEPDRSLERVRAITYMSPNFKDLTGILDPWDDNSWFSSLHPDDHEMVLRMQKNAAETGKFNEVLRLYHNEKEEWRWFNFISMDNGEAEGTVKVFNGFAVDITEHKRAEHRMLEYQKRLQDLTQKQFTSEERERRRVAEVLHDDVGQDLALALFKINQAREKSGDTGSVLGEVAPIIEQVISYTRSLTKELCPPALCQMGLASGLQWLSRKLEEQYQVQTTFESKDTLLDIDDEVGALIFRTTAELLTNVAKHGQAQKACVKIARNDNIIILQVEDDGVGFDYSPEALCQADGFGLFMLLERLRSQGGSLDIESRPGQGTKATAEIPL